MKIKKIDITGFLLTLLLFFSSICTQAQNVLKGVVLDSISWMPLKNITVQYGGSQVITDKDGSFLIHRIAQGDSIKFTGIGYSIKAIKYEEKNFNSTILLQAKDNTIEEVLVSTGYFKIPKERSTGSFSQVTNEQLQSIVAGGLQEKIEGLVVGMDYDRSRSYVTPINIRGLSTIASNASPLIILDNFPYEGELSTINPNDVESITVLKDAAAASIWGARAGNGVIVIVSKSGRYNSPLRLSFTANNTLGAQPDLFYSKKRVSAAKQMEIEEISFSNGAYQIRNQTAIPLYVELLQAKKENLITEQEFALQREAFANNDIRDSATKYLYQRLYNQQYAFNLNGGDNRQAYFVSANYDNNRAEVIGNTNRRLNTLLQHEFNLSSKLSFKTSLRYSKIQSATNGIELEAAVPAYMTFKDSNGEAAAFVKNYRFAYQQQAEALGLLDWLYRPLEDRGLSDRRKENNELLALLNIRYKLVDHLFLSGLYQYTDARDKNWTYYQKESFYVRDLVNRYTQANGAQIIPYGDIWSTDEGTELAGHQGRLQLDYNRVFSNWQFNGLAGAEIKQDLYTGIPRALIYGFSPETQTGVNRLDYLTRYTTRPTGSAQIPVASLGVSKVSDRFVSYYGNLATSWQNKIDFTGSVRWDASNLFGVKTNQKGIPLWSSGIAWNTHTLLRSDWVNKLRLSATYGYSGNVNRAVSVYNVVKYGTDQDTNLPIATLDRVGNPALRWESVRTWNTAMELSLWNNRMSTKLEVYNKKASDLIGEDQLDPTTGINSTILPKVTNMVNYASLRTKGIDVQLDVKVLRSTQFKWDMNVLFSKNTNRVKDYNMVQQTNTNMVLTTSPPRIGESLNAIYALPWIGLNPESGRTLLAEEYAGKTYREYYEKYPVDRLQIAGVSRAPYFGSINQQLSYANFTLGIQLIWKAGHSFRRESMLPGYEYFIPGQLHQDIDRRWQKSGDESFTTVPAAVAYTTSTTADSYYEGQVYKYASVLVEPADYIRLQNIQLSYVWQRISVKKLPFESLRILFNVRNVGILWRANRLGVDPDYYYSLYPNPRLASVSFQMQF